MIHTTATIRNRGQVTIPDKIREILSWVKPNSVVSIYINPQKELVFSPFKPKEIDWDDIWRRVRRSQSFKGKRGALSKFIIRDRERH